MAKTDDKPSSDPIHWPVYAALGGDELSNGVYFDLVGSIFVI